MKRSLDITGQKIGKWTVLKREPNDRHNQKMWLCRCECGVDVVVNGNNLLRGLSKGCRTCAGSALKYVGISVGQKIGKWTVLEEAPKTKNYQQQWLCECGGSGLVLNVSLLKDRSTRCKKCSRSAFKDLTGKVFGKWKVLDRLPNNRRNQSQWTCQCECGTTQAVSGSGLRNKSSTQCKKCAGSAPQDSLVLKGKAFQNIDEFVGAVIGTVLGDASISKSRAAKTYSLHFGHCAKQLNYGRYKKEMLSSLTPFREHINIQKKKYKQIKFCSRAHPIYSTLRDEFYITDREGRVRKRVSEKIMSQLTVCGLALWYQDDGRLKFENGFGSPMLCTDCFSKEENELMAQSLMVSFGLEWTIVKHEKKYYRLRLKNRFKSKFFDMIDSYIHESMRYKVNREGKLPVKGCVKLIDSICLYCEITFSSPIWYGNHRYCSPQCYHQSRQDILVRSVEITCRHCKTKFYVPRCKKDIRKFCSLACYHKTGRLKVITCKLE